eukprot:2984128-Rhodomonas_salina.3
MSIRPQVPLSRLSPLNPTPLPSAGTRKTICTFCPIGKLSSDLRGCRITSTCTPRPALASRTWHATLPSPRHGGYLVHD